MIDHSRKLKKASRMLGAYPAAEREIFRLLPESAIGSLTSSQIADVCKAIDKSYHNGRAAAGAEMISDDAVYIDSLQKIIEWREEGAVYERVTEVDEKGYTINYAIKVKDGALVARFVDNKQSNVG